jgi:hypothetical protein
LFPLIPFPPFVPLPPAFVDVPLPPLLTPSAPEPKEPPPPEAPLNAGHDPARVPVAPPRTLMLENTEPVALELIPSAEPPPPTVTVNGVPELTLSVEVLTPPAPPPPLCHAPPPPPTTR